MNFQLTAQYQTLSFFWNRVFCQLGEQQRSMPMDILPSLGVVVVLRLPQTAFLLILPGIQGYPWELGQGS